MPADLRSPESVGRPAGAVVVRTFAADRKVEIYDMFHMPGTYMPPTGFVPMTHDTYNAYTSLFLFSAKRRDFNLRAGLVLPTPGTDH